MKTSPSKVLKTVSSVIPIKVIFANFSILIAESTCVFADNNLPEIKLKRHKAITIVVISIKTMSSPTELPLFGLLY